MKRLIICGLLSSFVAGLSGCSEPFEIIAHRGASHLAPENTMASVMLAWEKNANVEIDVHLSKDNRIVVIHNASTKDITKIDLNVKDTTSEELRKLDYGSFKGPEFAGEPIPFLEDVLKTIPPDRKLYVEIKCGKEILPLLKQRIVESGKISQIVIIGFDIETVASSKKLIDVPTYWLKGTEKTKKTEKWIPHDPDLVRMAKDRGLDGLNVHYAGVTRQFVDAVKASGQKLYVWTVDDPKEAKRLIKLGVSGITTNRPEWLRKQIGRTQQGSMLRPIVCLFVVGGVLCLVEIWCGLRGKYLGMKIAEGRRILAILIAGSLLTLAIVCIFTFLAHG